MTTIFDPEQLQKVARAAARKPVADLLETVPARLQKLYPGHIDTAPAWIFNNAGGAMGQMAILHSSLSEYLILFGTPIGTEGHSGRYRTEVWDFMIAGECWTYIEGETERTVSRPGDCMYLGPSDAKGYRIPESAWMLEYARGPIPTMLAFGLADTLFSTLDLRTFGRTFWTYGRLACTELLRGKV